MSFIIKKEKHHDLRIALSRACNELEEEFIPTTVKVRHQPGKKDLIQDLTAVTRTTGEDYSIRMKIANLEGVLKELKKLK